jgi:hypothetical protein
MQAQTTGRFRVRDSMRGGGGRFAILDDGGRSLDGAPLYVDSFRTRSAAESPARLLNAGLATVDPHALIGCRLVVK